MSVSENSLPLIARSIRAVTILNRNSQEGAKAQLWKKLYWNWEEEIISVDME